jgi:fatty-acyl-CoA synthase
MWQVPQESLKQEVPRKRRQTNPVVASALTGRRGRLSRVAPCPSLGDGFGQGNAGRDCRPAPGGIISCMRNQGMGSWIARRATVAPGSVALIADQRQWTYAELAAEVAATAGALADSGVRWGDRVCYLGDNHAAALTSAFAAGLLGAVFVPLSQRRPASDLAAIVDDAECRLVLYRPDATAAVEPLRDGRRRFVVAGEPVADDPSLADLTAARSRSQAPDLPVGLDDLCFLLYTSGTTGPSKGVMLTHGNVTWNVVNFHTVADYRASDVALAIAPLYRAGGWGVTLLPTIHKGGTIVLPSAFEPREVLGLIGRHAVTTLFGGPELLGALVRSDAWEDADLSSLRIVISGGSIVHEVLIRAYLARGVSMLQGYGLTEASPMCLMINEDDALRKLGSAGVPPLHTDVRVVHSDMTNAAPGEVGELVVRGPNVMRGYWRRPEETEAALAGGWLHTGDAATVDEEGFFFFVDRLSHAFSVGGRRVFPAQIERVLVEHDAVLEAAVVPRPDASLVQAPVAFVVLVPGASVSAAELLAFCAARLPADEVPVALKFRGRLPKNPAGKVLKAELAADAARAVAVAAQPLPLDSAAERAR